MKIKIGILLVFSLPYCHPSQPSQFLWHYYIIWSAQHFETDMNLYNTDMVDYTIMNDSPGGFIAVVCIIKPQMNEQKLMFIMQEIAPSSSIN